MKRWVIGSLATALLVSSEVKGLDREGVFDALVNAAIYTKLCDGAILANTQKILSSWIRGTFSIGRRGREKAAICRRFHKKIPRPEGRFVLRREAGCRRT